MLEIHNLKTNYGHIVALNNISIEVTKGQIVSIIGSNGAGKTTLLNSISGLLKPKQGTIRFMDQALLPIPHQVVKKGIVQVPEGRKVFAGLSIKENLIMGGFLIKKKSQLEENMERVFSLFPVLKERSHQFAGTLSGGEQQMLAFGRGLMSNPKLMLLDEPSLGLAPQLVNTVFNAITEIRDSQITVLLVEQNAKKALNLCNYAYVLENGVVTIAGRGKDLLKDPRIKNAYLGEDIVLD